MQAIVKVSKKSAYAHLNGHTFHVKEVLFNGNSAPVFALNIGGTTTDFTAKEVMLVGINQENMSKFLAIKKYAKINNIKL